VVVDQFGREALITGLCREGQQIPATRSIIRGINAGVVRCFVDLDPVCPVYAPRVSIKPADRIGGCNYDVGVVSARNHLDFINGFRQVLVLAEDDKDVSALLY